MSAYDAYKKRKTEKEEKPSVNSAYDAYKQKSEQSSFSTVEFSSVGNLKHWVNAANKFAVELEDFYNGNYDRWDSQFGTSYDGKIESALESGNAALEYLRKNQNDIQNYEELRNGIQSYVDAFNTAKKQFSSTRDYYSQWKSEDDYGKWQVDWLNTEGETNAEKVAGRKDIYEKNKARISEIEEELPWYAKSALPNFIENWFLSKENEVIRNEAEGLETENRKYERTQSVMDGYYDYSTRADFDERSAKRDYVNPTADEMQQKGVAMDSSTWVYDPNTELYRDTLGNLIDPKNTDENGTVLHPWADKYEVTDPLGLFLSASDEDKEHAYAREDGGDQWAAVVAEGLDRSWSQLDDTEIKTYYYILDSEGYDAAYNYLLQMQVELNRREAAEKDKDIEEASGLEKLALNVASVPASVIGGIPSIIEDATYLALAGETNPYSRNHDLQNFSSSVRSHTAEDINDLTNDFSVLGVTLGDAYQSVMSGVDSLVAASAFGSTGAGVVLGTNAASAEIKRLYEAGASGHEMAWGGILHGAAEMFFEKFSIDRLLNAGGAKNLWQIAKNWAMQGVTEMSEEAATEFANIVTDSLVRGSQSDFSQNIQSYKDQGLSQGAATWEALKDAGVDIWKAGAGGFISGGGMSVGHSAMSNAVYNSQAKAKGREILENDGYKALRALAQDVSGVQKEGKLSRMNAGTDVSGLLKKADAKTSARNVGKLSDAVETYRITKNVSEITSELQKAGLKTKEAKQVAQLMSDTIDGKSLTEKEHQRLEDIISENDAVLDVWNGLANQQVVEGKRLSDSHSVNVRNKQHNLGRKGVVVDEGGVYATENTPEPIRKVLEGNSLDDAKIHFVDKLSLSEDGVTRIASTGEEVTIDKSNAIAKVENVNGEEVAFYNTDQGVVAATDITYSNESEGLIFEGFADLSPAIANAAIKAYDGTTPAKTFVSGMREGILLYGKHNFQEVGKDISTDSSFAHLSKADQNTALKLGRMAADIETKSIDEKLKSAIRTAAANVGKDSKGKPAKKGGVYFEEGVEAKTDKQRAAVDLAKKLSEVTGIDIHFYDATIAGTKNADSNGYYDPSDNSIHLDMQNSILDSKTIVFTLSHEMVHFVKRWSPAKFKTFADFLIKNYADHNVDTSTLLANKMADLKTTDSDYAFEELVCDACERMLIDSNAMEKLSELQKKDKDLVEKIKQFIRDILDKIRSLYKDIDPTTDEGVALQKMEYVIGEFYKLFEDMTVDAVQNFQAAQVLETESVSISEDGTVQMQMKQYRETGRSTLLKYLREQYGDADANDLISTIDSIYNAMAEVKKDTALSVFGNWQETDVELDESGHPIFTTSINNGDYELNQDFSRVCKKRRQLNFVLNMLAKDPAFEASNLTTNDFVKINKAIKEHGFEIACALCFVDSKRFRQSEWADSFASTWNDILGSMKADKKALSRFNFATDSVNMADDGIKVDPSKPITYRKWSKGKATETRTYKNLDDLLKNDGNANVKRIATLIRDNPNLRHEFRGADIIASDGFDSIQRLAPDVRGILDGWGGTSVPKPSSNDAIYDNSILNLSGYNAKKAFAVGGVRMNSFSDFMAHMFFDYAQAFADLSAKQLPMHSYTKELDFARLFGLTGGKINMSAIAAIRSNAADISKVKGKQNKEAATEFEKSIAGLDLTRLAEKLGKADSDITYDDVIQNLNDVDYVWADESINVQSATLLQSGILYDNLTEGKAAYCYELIREGKFEEAFNVAGKENVNKGYAKHLGIITVGVSKAHILKLLRDPTIRMVIPYHKSGLNAEVAKEMKIAFYEDFTDVQNTMVKFKGGKSFGISSDSSKVNGNKIKDFAFYDYFGKTVDGVFYDGKKTAEKYREWCEKGSYDESVGDYVYYLSGGGHILASELHTKGIEILPKFYEFATEENYYKLIEDFDCYDTITGEHSSQEAVDMFHDGLPSDYKDVLVKALKAEQKVYDDFEDHLNNKGLKDEIMEIVKENQYAPSDPTAPWEQGINIPQLSLGNGIASIIKAETNETVVEGVTDLVNTAEVKKQKKRTETYSAIGKETLQYADGNRQPDLTLVEIVNERTGKKEKTITHYGDKPKGYIPKKIAYCYKLFEQHPDGSLHALFAGAGEGQPIGEWVYAKGFPYTDSGVKGMNLRERYGWHLSAGLPSAPHLMSSKSFERGYPSKNAYGHKKGSKRVWVRMAYDATNDYNSVADSTVGKVGKGDIFGLAPFGGYYAFKENNQSEWVISSGVKIDKILSEEERQQILRDAGYDEYEAWRLKHHATAEEKAERESLQKRPQKVKDAELAASALAMREKIKSRIIDNPELSEAIKYQKKTPNHAPTFYSQMGKVIDDIKDAKIGSASIVTHLKNRGVRNDEIKWSGIEAFLEGKKSVTKEELQAFVAGSQLQIEEVILDNKERPYTEDEQNRIAEYEAKRDEVVKRVAAEWKRITNTEFPVRNAGAGLESAVANAIVDKNLEDKNATFEGKLLKKLRNDLKEVIKNNDDFGFDSEKDALRSIHRHRREFIDYYEMSTKDKAVIVKYCNALNAYNELPSTINYDDADNLRAIAREAEPLNRKIMEVKHEHNEEEAKYMTNWQDYKLAGGKNYKEMLFVIPDSMYSNHAMYVHWKEREGVLAHARVQDFDVNGQKMLFVEEIQSDWHNEGHKKGYREKGAKTSDKFAWESEAAYRKFYETVEGFLAERGEYANPALLANLFDGEQGSRDYIRSEYKLTAEEMRYIDSETAKEAKRKTERDAAPSPDSVPDAPFQENYHEYVLKRLLRMAAEEGYDSIGWTPASVQMDRWNPMRKTNAEMGVEDAKNPDAIAFERAYEIEYDTRIRKFLRSFGNKFGAAVGTTTLGNGTEVWSMDITEPMVQSVLYDGQAMFQKKKLSNRTILANALESSIDTSTQEGQNELSTLKRYHADIAKAEKLDAHLAEVKAELRDLSFSKGKRDTARINELTRDKRETEHRINTYDRRLLSLESTKPLRDLLAREKELVKKRTAQKGKEKLSALREKHAATIRDIMSRNQESRKKNIENRHSTQMRHKIKDIVADLNNVLLDPTKERHVPIGLQKSVAEALDVINMDTIDADARVAEYNERIAKSSNPDEIAKLVKSRDYILYQGENLKERLMAFKAAYAEIKNSDDPMVRNSHDEAIEALIEKTVKEVGNTSLKDMTLEQLELVYDMFKAVRSTVQLANKMFKAARQATVSENSESVKTEVREVGGQKARVVKITKFARKYGWNSLKPIYAMRMIGSDTLTDLYNNVRKGEDTWAVDVMEAREVFLDNASKYGYWNWDLQEQFDFLDMTGKEFSISVEQIMSLYAYYKRKQADKHLEFGGFIFGDTIEVTEKKHGIPIKYEVNDANPYRLSKEIVEKIALKLTAEQRSFVDSMQKYLSDDMGAKGNEVSLAMYDIKLFKEKNYFPLKTSRYFREFDPEKNGTPKIKNSGFSKNTIPQAGNPIVLDNFMDVWANHVNEMSMYHAFVLPLEDYMRVYNYSSIAGGYDSVRQYIKNAYSNAACQYIETLVNDLNGGARVDPTADIMSKGIGLFKKAAVFSSASVVIQQPSAIARAAAILDNKYFASKLSLTQHKAEWEEVKKYAPVAIIKEMGYFDVNMGMSTVQFIKSKKYDKFSEKAKAVVTDSSYRDEVLSKAPALADELSWCYIWNAVKKEIAETTNLEKGSDEFLKKAGERFTEVVTLTQVYDSVLSRSAMMRSKDTGMKMAMAFMAEPTTSMNMLVDAIVQGKRGNRKTAAKAVGAVVASLVLNSILVSFVYAGRDDDEDNTYVEKYIGTLSKELVDSLNPMAMMPFVKDIISIFQGYDVARTDMSIVADLYDAWKSLSNEDRSVYRKVEDFVGAIAKIFGLPLKNIMRDARGLYNTTTSLFTGTKTSGKGIHEAVKESITGEELSNGDVLYDAILHGDQDWIDRVKARFANQDAIDTAVRKALRENDPRIREAAQAELDGNPSERVRIAREIVGEGNFSQDNIVKAINAEVNALSRGDSSSESPEEDDNDEVTSYYSANDINVALESGDTTTAKTIINDLVRTKVANGMEEKNAKSSVKRSISTYWKPLYKSASESERARIRKLLHSTGLYGSASDVVETCRDWLKD